MNTTLIRQHLATPLAAVLLALTSLALLPAPAHAIRIPADPVAFVTTPVLLAQLTTSGHAASVWAAIEELRADVDG